MDDAAKKSFLAMPLKEQMLAILFSQEYIRAELVKVINRQINFEQGINDYRTRRETDELDQTQRIAKAVVDELKKGSK